MKYCGALSRKRKREHARMSANQPKKSSGLDVPRIVAGAVLACVGGVVLTGIVLIAAGVYSFTGKDAPKAPTEHASAPDDEKKGEPRQTHEGHVDEPMPKDKSTDVQRDRGDTPNLIMPFRDRADFLGSTSEGRRFCIIADNSNSVAGASLAQLKKEIMRTITQLKPTSQFFIIYFNKTDFPMPFPNWLSAEKENIEKVRPWVEQAGTALGTRPNSSFVRAFKLDPPPDCIFFMTDGQFQNKKTEDVVELLNRLNAKEPKVQVNTIWFTKGSGKTPKKAAPMTVLRNIAEKNGGTFKHFSAKSASE